MKQKVSLEVGQRYRGWGWINEFGEFEFSPEEKGARLGQVKAVKQGDNFKVSESKKYVLVHMKVEKSGTTVERLQYFLSIVKDIIDILKTYDF